MLSCFPPPLFQKVTCRIKSTNPFETGFSDKKSPSALLSADGPLVLKKNDFLPALTQRTVSRLLGVFVHNGIDGTRGLQLQQDLIDFGNPPGKGRFPAHPHA